MVVMEHVDGTTLAVAKADIDKEKMEEVRSQVKKAIKLLHDHNFVFGDLRLPNIMVTRDMKVRLIDFNWAGVEGQSELLGQIIQFRNCIRSLLISRGETVFMNIFKNPSQGRCQGEYDFKILRKLLKKRNGIDRRFVGVLR